MIYTIVGKTDTPMPDLIIMGDDLVKHRFDPFVSCSISLVKFKDNLAKIREYCDTLIGRQIEVDLSECGSHFNMYGGCYFPYNRKQFTIKRAVSQQADSNLR